MVRELWCHNEATNRHRRHHRLVNAQGRVTCECGEQIPLFHPDEIAVILRVTPDGLQFTEVWWECLDGKHRAIFKDMGGGQKVRELVEALTGRRVA